MVDTPRTIEDEIAELERLLVEKKKVLEEKTKTGDIKNMPSEKEVLKEVVREKIETVSEPIYKAEQLKTEVKPREVEPKLEDKMQIEPPSYLSEELRPVVQELVDLAFGEPPGSLYKAIEAAKATKNPAVIEAFHSLIVDKIYDYLVERGKLRKI